MEGSFIYDKSVTGKNFLGRKSDVTAMKNFLLNGENVLIYDIPKTGKSSLIDQTILQIKTSGQAHDKVLLDLLNIRSVEEFLLSLGSKILAQCGTTSYDRSQAVIKYLEGTNFSSTLLSKTRQDKLICLKDKYTEDDVTAILSLASKVGEEKGKRIFVILEEFQNIMQCDGGEDICRIFNKFLSERNESDKSWSNFIFCGSSFNAMREIFDEKKIFFRTFERCRISQIETKEIVEFIVKGFLSSGKVIDRDLLVAICEMFHNHIWYIIHFCAICDSLSKGYVMEPILNEGMDILLSIHEPKFKAMMNDLTTFQISLLKAIVDGNTKFSSTDVINNYGLNSSANVRRLKDALYKKEIISFNEKNEGYILDPLFEYWVRTRFFNLKGSKF